MEDIESVKRRVKKLLALSKSPNENEAAAAFRKANDLMAAYKFTSEQFSAYTETKVKGTKRFIRWRVVLANAVENLYATYHYNDHEENIVFVLVKNFFLRLFFIRCPASPLPRTHTAYPRGTR